MQREWELPCCSSLIDGNQAFCDEHYDHFALHIAINASERESVYISKNKKYMQNEAVKCKMAWMVAGENVCAMCYWIKMYYMDQWTMHGIIYVNW